MAAVTASVTIVTDHVPMVWEIEEALGRIRFGDYTISTAAADGGKTETRLEYKMNQE